MKSYIFKNERGFQDITLKFPHGNLAVFVGINGAGKSTILDCIAIMLAQFVAKLCNREVADIEVSENDIRLNSDSNINTITISVENGQQISWRMVEEKSHGQNHHNNYAEIENYLKHLQKKLESQPDLNLPVMVYYQTHRIVLKNPYTFGDKKVEPEKYYQFHAYQKAFESEINNFQDFFEWFQVQEDYENEIRLRQNANYRNPKLEILRNAITNFLNKFLHQNFSNLRVVRSIADNFVINSVKPSLIITKNTTKQLFQETTQTAIQNAVNAKAEKAYAWLRDGCAKVFSAQIVTVTAMTMFALYIPSRLAEASVVSLLQGRMFSDISKTFEYKFEPSFIQDTLTTSLGIPINDVFGGMVEKTANSSPLSENHFETIQDLLSYFISNLQQLAETLPFKEQLIEVLSNIAKCKIIANLPIVKGISALSTTLTTALIAIAYIETLKKYKVAEYQGEPLPNIQAELQEQMRLVYQQIKNIFFGRAGENWT